MRNKQLLVFFASIISCFILGMLSYSPYGSLPHNLAIFSSFFVFVSIFTLVVYRSMSSIFIIPFISLNWVYFQSPFLLKEKTSYFLRIIKDEYVNEIAFYTSMSILLIYIGYSFFFNKPRSVLTPTNYQFSNQSLKKLVYIFIVMGGVFRIGELASPVLVAQLSNIIQILFYGPTIVFALYVLYHLRSGIKFEFSAFSLITILFLFTEFAIRLSTTLFAQVIILFLGVLLAYFREKRKIPIIAISVLLLLLYPLYEVRKAYRLKIVGNEKSSSAINEGIKLVEDVYIDGDQFSKELDGFRKNQYNKKHNRFENLSFISHVVLLHKTGVKPFLNGSTFYWLPLVPIPRIIFPAKPENVMSTEVATSYGLRGVVSKASINFPMLVEAYINFDFHGMLIMSLLFGIAYKFFVVRVGFGLGDINLLIIINSIKQFMHAEGNITLVFGAMIQVYIFWWLLIRLVNFNKYGRKV